MQNLENLPSVSRLSERVLRVLGQNPGKYTLQGTNTYLLGRRNPFILLDTGDGNDDYIPLLGHVLRESVDPSSPFVSDIILTHRHADHTQGLPSVLTLLRHLWGDRPDFTPPRVHKFPLPPQSRDSALQSMLDQLPSNLILPEPTTGGYIHELKGSQTLKGDDTTLQVIHTPGHTPDSICLYLNEEKSLFTADSVLGQGTAVFEDLAAYITSLRALLQLGGESSTQFTRVYPGHGPVVNDGPRHIESYIEHRMERENQIVKVLSSPPSGEMWTLGTLVANIYAEYPQSLWPAAAGSILLHLAKLEKEGRVVNLGGESEDMKWQLARL